MARSIDWEGIALRRFGKVTATSSSPSLEIASFVNALEVARLPPSFWRREYIYRYLGALNRCSLCGGKPIFTGPLFDSVSFRDVFDGNICFCRGCLLLGAWNEILRILLGGFSLGRG